MPARAPARTRANGVGHEKAECCSWEPTRPWVLARRSGDGVVVPGARKAEVVVTGEEEVAARGPRVGAVAQAGAGQGVEVLGEPMGLAQGAEAGADVVREPEVAGAA